MILIQACNMGKLNKIKELLTIALFIICSMQKIVMINGENNTEIDVTKAEIKKLVVKIYYETLCRDSIYFIKQQLYPFLMNENMLQYTDLRFVPYGKVNSWKNSRTEVTSFFCQHGNEECELNAMHACIVEHNSIEEQLKMINCLLGRSSNAIKCAQDLGIDIIEAKKCKNSRDLWNILSKYGKDTDALGISFVPTITFNEIFEPYSQQQIFYNFPRAFCKTYEKTFNTTLLKCAAYLK